VRTCLISPASDTDRFRFQVQEGEQFVVRGVDQSGAGPDPRICVRLSGPDGPLDEACNYGIVQFTNVGVRAGEYALEVWEFGRDQGMNYTVVVERVAPPSEGAAQLNAGESLTGALDPIGDVDVFGFRGAVGDRVTLTVRDTAGSGASPSFGVRSPSGVVLADLSDEERASVDLDLHEAGIYTLVVDEAYQDQTLQYSVDYICRAGSCGRGRGALCEIGMSRSAYRSRELVQLRTWRLRNGASEAVPIEEKASLVLPDGEELSLLNPQGEFWSIPGGYDEDFGPVNLFRVDASWPRGEYGIGCRIVHPDTGETEVVDGEVFRVE